MIKVLAGLVSSRASPWLADGYSLAAFSHGRPSAHKPLSIFSYKDTSQIRLTPTLITSF